MNGVKYQRAHVLVYASASVLMSLVLVEGRSDVVYHSMLPINPLTEFLVSRLVQISVQPEKAPLQKSLHSFNISRIADMIGTRLINLVHDDECRIPPRLAGVFEDERSAESGRDWRETQLRAHSDVRAVLVSLFMHDFSRCDIFQQAMPSGTIDTWLG
jgi:hypothetical protein